MIYCVLPHWNAQRKKSGPPKKVGRPNHNQRGVVQGRPVDRAANTVRASYTARFSFFQAPIQPAGAASVKANALSFFLVLLGDLLLLPLLFCFRTFITHRKPPHLRVGHVCCIVEHRPFYRQANCSIGSGRKQGPYGQVICRSTRRPCKVHRPCRCAPRSGPGRRGQSDRRRPPGGKSAGAASGRG